MPESLKNTTRGQHVKDLGHIFFYFMDLKPVNNISHSPPGEDVEDICGCRDDDGGDSEVDAKTSMKNMTVKLINVSFAVNSEGSRVNSRQILES